MFVRPRTSGRAEIPPNKRVRAIYNELALYYNEDLLYFFHRFLFYKWKRYDEEKWRLCRHGTTTSSTGFSSCLFQTQFPVLFSRAHCFFFLSTIAMGVRAVF